MKISMMSYTMARGEWGKNHDIEELCKFTRELDLEGIDWVTTYGVDPEEIRRISDDYGLKTVCYTFFVDINFPDKKDRQSGIDKIKEGIEIALILGTDKIMLPIGGKDGFSREQSKRNVIAGLKNAVEIGKEYGVTITVEHFSDRRGPFVVSADINEALKEVPALRVTYDNGNVYVGGEDPVAGFVNSSEAIVHAHFKDWELSTNENGLRGHDGRTYIGALVGEGLIDHKSIVEAMKKSNYTGYINFEYEGSKYEPKDATIKGINYLRSLITN
jgi:sugar phosphate isomerase/epimerase